MAQTQSCWEFADWMRLRPLPRVRSLTVQSADWEFTSRVGHVLVKTGFDMIKKVKAGYKVVSSKGKNLGGPYKTLEAAKKRLRQVEFFKRSK